MDQCCKLWESGSIWPSNRQDGVAHNQQQEGLRWHGGRKTSENGRRTFWWSEDDTPHNTTQQTETCNRNCKKSNLSPTADNDQCFRWNNLSVASTVRQVSLQSQENRKHKKKWSRTILQTVRFPCCFFEFASWLHRKTLWLLGSWIDDAMMLWFPEDYQGI
jgi:hypothetical protein